MSTLLTSANLSETTVEKADRPTPAEPAPGGLSFRVAGDAASVTAAWRVVYDVYLRSGFINANPHLIHTSAPMVSSHAAVLLAEADSQIEATLTAVIDGPAGLPLDSVYKPELDQLRRSGRRITEYGSFAHVRQLGSPDLETAAGAKPRAARLDSRVHASIVGLMRLAFHFGATRNSSDFVIGVHPRHVAFYARGFGFRPVGGLRTYPAVNDRPVVLLHGNLQESLARNPLPHALAYCLNNPVPIDMFKGRYDFSRAKPSAAHARLEAYLREKQGLLSRLRQRWAS